jgi:hypothetical protein
MCVCVYVCVLCVKLIDVPVVDEIKEGEQHTHTHRHTQNTHKHTHKNTHTQKHTHTHAHTHTHMNKDMCIDTHVLCVEHFEVPVVDEVEEGEQRTQAHSHIHTRTVR